MLVFRKRLIYWLIKEYIRKSGRSIFFFFSVGLVFFFIFSRVLPSGLFSILPINNESTGIVGSYTLERLPSEILSQLSVGLTSVSEDGKIWPAISEKWKIEQDGKRYVFTLKKNLHFTDGSTLTSNDINYNFSRVTIKKIDRYTISFELKEQYSPFLVSVSRPVFKKGLIGTGTYRIKKITLNNDFVESLTLVSTKNSFNTKKYLFYPTAAALKTAYMLGEVSKAVGLLDTTYKNFNLAAFANTAINRQIDSSQMVVLFYNTRDSILSEREVRNALSYAQPDNFPQGKRAYTPISPFSWAYAEQYVSNQDLEYAQVLLSSSNAAKNSKNGLTFEIKTFAEYKKVAENIAKSLAKIGVKSKIAIVDSIPANYQIFIGNFFVPKDPDQYMLWHSGQENNITRYENKRIDKLLEDGRKTADINERKKIYADFQKYLLADSPASFLYFPYEYEITRK